MKNKTCSICKESKDITDFFKDKYKTDGHHPHCKTCKKSYKKKWNQANKDKVRRSSRKWYQTNKDKVKQQVKQWQANNPEKYHAIVKQYRREIRKTPKGKLDHTMGNTIRKVLVSQKSGRKWESLVGYTVNDLISHLEKQFDEFMTWENYGSYWHLDHVVPKSYFNYESPEDAEFMKCWALENLQPLEATENLQKTNKLSV